MKTTRKLQEGDRLMAYVDLSAGILEISLNDTECKHRFNLPPGSAQDFLFAVTMVLTNI
jgi:hypothetical protein